MTFQVLRKWMVRPTAAVLLGGCMVAAVSADTIRLKNGQTVTGKIVRYENRRFTIVYERSSPDTRAVIALDDIDSVEFDGRPLPNGTEGANSGGYNDPNRQPGTVPDDRPDTTQPVPQDNRPSVPPSENRPDNDGSGGPPSANIQTITVGAKEDWSYAKIDVKRGDRIRITADGRVRLNSRQESSPDGIEAEDPNKLMPGRPTGALIAVIGDDNNDFIFIGSSREFVAQRSGKLFLSVNEGDLSDNSGGFQTRVEITRGR